VQNEKEYDVDVKFTLCLVFGLVVINNEIQLGKNMKFSKDIYTVETNSV